MHMNRIHGILRRAGLKPYNPIRGDHVGYCIYYEQFPFDPVRHVCVYFRSTTPWEKLPLEQAQEAAIAALSLSSLEVEVTKTIDDWPAVEFEVVAPKTYRRLKTYSTSF